MAERVRAIVDSAGTIAEAARITGIPVNTVSRMCAGLNEPGAFAAATFARRMGVSLDYLLGLSDSAPITPETAATAAPAAASPATASIPPPLDESRLEELIRSVLVAYADLPGDEAAALARSLIERARSPRARRESAPDEGPPPDTPVSASAPPAARERK